MYNYICIYIYIIVTKEFDITIYDNLPLLDTNI